MRFFGIAAVAASLLSSAGLVAALPRTIIISPEQFEIAVLGGSTFRVSQAPNPGFISARRGPRSLAKAFNKYGQIPPDLLIIVAEILQELGIQGVNLPTNSPGSTGAPQANQTSDTDQGEVAAVPQMFDSEYLAEVQIGTPPQTLMLNFDTGSSDMWVFSSDTPRAQVGGQVLYNAQQSSTAKKLEGETWNIKYGDGSGSNGIVYTDTVTVGGVTVAEQAVESATNVSGTFSRDAASSGLLGLAMSKINRVMPTPQKTFFSNAMENLAMPLFTANLKKSTAGNYNFGFIDKTEFSGDISFIDLNTTNGFWQFEASGFSVGNMTMTAMPHQAIADTGTTLLLLPDAMVTAYYRQVRGAQNSPKDGGFVFSCDEVLPALTLNIGTYKAVVPGDVINFAPVDQTNATCFGGIQSGGNLPFAIYGDVFLKSQFTVFHGGNAQIGFAQKPVQ